jgi:hypothetical protein
MKMGWQKVILQVFHFQHEEARLFYLKGLVEAVEHKDVDTFCIHQALPLLSNDSESLEVIIRKYALHEVFFAGSDNEKLDRLNQSLNIYWALVIISKLSSTYIDYDFCENHVEWICYDRNEVGFDEVDF